MRALVIVSLAVVVGLVALAEAKRTDDIHWKVFKKAHKKSYADAHEEALRKTIFLANKQKIDQHNEHHSERLGFRMGYSHLTDWTADERNSLNGLLVDSFELNKVNKLADAPDFLKRMLAVDVEDLPKEVDWRKVANRVSAVKDQGQCGSCWAFATTGVLEGQEASLNLTNGQLVPLSEQNLVDCSDTDLKCRGGIMSHALADIAKEHGIESEKDYPYLDVNGPVEHDCVFNRKKSVLTVKGSQILDGTEESLQKVVAQFGPVATAMACTEVFQHYTGGILNDETCDPDKLNHGVLVVGYGTDAKQGDFWIVKNSWSADWGEEGYFRLARNKDNLCGIATIPTIPVF